MTIWTSDKQAELRLFQEFSGAWHVSVETSIDRIDDGNAYSVVAHIAKQREPFVFERFGTCSTSEREACDDLCRESANVVREWVHPLRIEDITCIDESIKRIAARYHDRLDVAAIVHCCINIT